MKLSRAAESHKILRCCCPLTFLHGLLTGERSGGVLATVVLLRTISHFRCLSRESVERTVFRTFDSFQIKVWYSIVTITTIVDVFSYLYVLCLSMWQVTVWSIIETSREYNVYLTSQALGLFIRLLFLYIVIIFVVLSRHCCMYRILCLISICYNSNGCYYFQATSHTHTKPHTKP